MNYFITSEQLKTQLGKVVIFDCRFNLMNKAMGHEQYREGHIPGAYFLDLEHDLSGKTVRHGGRHPLPDIETLSAKLRAAGVTTHSTIVVYDDSRMGYAAHAWWLLRYVGHEQVAILDGGFTAWKDAGGAIDRREPAPKKGNFVASLQAGWIVDREDILRGGDELILIDSREVKRYRGEEEPIDPVAGHIPGALNFFWQDATTEQGFIKPLQEQRERWATLIKQGDIEMENVAEKENIVVYCGSGVTACVNLLSLEMCGIRAKLYPGSWSDWCSYFPQENS